MLNNINIKTLVVMVIIMTVIGGSVHILRSSTYPLWIQQQRTTQPGRRQSSCRSLYRHPASSGRYLRALGGY